MSSTARFFLWKYNIWVLRTRKLPDAKFFIHSILRNWPNYILIRWNHSITNIFRSFPDTSFLCLCQQFQQSGSQIKFLSIALCVIDLVIMLIRWNHSITNICRIKLSRYLFFMSIPTLSSVRISNKMVKYSHWPPKIENQHGRHIYDEENHKFAITFQFF